MQTDHDFYEEKTISDILEKLNTNYFTELAELVEMTFGPFGFRLLCHYHRWETAEKNDRMFREHTDETTRVFTIPFLTQPRSREEPLMIVDTMMNDAPASYLNGFDKS